MKNSFILLFICFFLTNLSAQIQFNPKIGWNKFKFKPGEESVLKSSKERGFQIGVDFRIGGVTYLQPGIHFVGTNSKYLDSRVDIIDSIDKARLESVKVPLSLGRLFLDLEVFQVHGRLGGVANFPLKVEDVSPNFVTINSYEDVNFGATGGIGIEIFRVSFDIQYEHAFTDILVDDKGSKNHLWSFSLGYLF